MEQGTGDGPRLRPTRLDFGDGVRLSGRSMVLVALVALVPVLAAIGVVLILSVGTGQPVTPGRDDVQGVSDGGGDSGGDSGEGSGEGSGGGSGDAAAPTGVAEADRDDAADALRAADVGRVGSVEGAWTWRDGGTETLLVVTRRVTRRNGDLSARAVTLQVTTVADPRGRPARLAAAQDEGRTCPRGTEMKADLDPRDVAVRDLDGDGTREAVVGWAHRCDQDVERRVTVLSGAAAYVLTGRAVVVAEPDPPLADWPEGFLDAATQALADAG